MPKTYCSKCDKWVIFGEQVPAGYIIERALRQAKEENIKTTKNELEKNNANARSLYEKYLVKNKMFEAGYEYNSMATEESCPKCGSKLVYKHNEREGY